jgi:beta-lactamase superfamily II metal-dependent hydrolase
MTTKTAARKASHQTAARKVAHKASAKKTVRKVVTGKVARKAAKSTGKTTTKSSKKTSPATATTKKGKPPHVKTSPDPDATPAFNAGSASGLKVRMYRVGFGDFFLVTVPTGAGNRYILIDCGVFKGTTGLGDIGSIEEAVEDLFTTTGGQLALVIMTHRHADHIAGFSRAAERFKDFKASMVWMPYWEQFNDAAPSPASNLQEDPNFAFNLQSDVSRLATQLAMQFRGRTDEAAQDALSQLSDATGFEFDAAAPGGKKGGGNAVALDLLKNHLGDNGKNVRYYAHGDVPELPPELEGLSATIYGPPPKDAKAFMKLTDLKKNVGQYLDSTTSSETGARAIHPFGPQWCNNKHLHYPQKDAQGFPIKYQEIEKLVVDAQPDMLAAAAAKIDTFLNNQSLVVLFTFAGKKLLFVGDAQAGNWEHWLYKLDVPVNDPTKAGSLTEESQQVLQTVDFYKMGHHGSTNATPIPVVNALGKGHSANSFVAMCSTQIGVYGNPDPAKGTEVPRAPLIKALGDECALVRSDSFEITLSDKTKVAPGEGAAAALPTPKVGTLSRGDLYVEYSF